MGISSSSLEDRSLQKHFDKWESVVHRLELIKNIQFPGDVKKSTSRKIVNWILNNLNEDAMCRPALQEELKRQVKEESLESFKQCFNDRGEAIKCLEEVQKNLDTSKIEITEVFNPIPIAPPLPSISSSSIPGAPPLPGGGGGGIPNAPPINSVVLGQVVNPDTKKVEAIVRPTGMQMVDKPFTPEPNTEIVKGTPTQTSALLEAIRQQGGKPAKTSYVKDQVQASKSLTEDINLVATSTGPDGKPSVVPVSDSRQDLLSQIRGGSTNLRKVQSRNDDDDDDIPAGGSVQSQILNKLKSDPSAANPLFAAIEARRAKLEKESDDDDDAFDDDEFQYSYNNSRKNRNNNNRLGDLFSP